MLKNSEGSIKKNNKKILLIIIEMEILEYLLSTTDNVDYYSEILNDYDISHSAYHSKLDWRDKRDIEKNLKSILVTTFKSAKGLEFDTVIMPELEHAETKDKNQHFVGATRARGQSIYTMQFYAKNIRKF